jgi:hypothetical protein
LGLADGFLFILREGGSYILTEKRDKGSKKPVETLFLGGFFFAQTTSPMPLVNVVSDVCG